MAEEVGCKQNLRLNSALRYLYAKKLQSPVQATVLKTTSERAPSCLKAAPRLNPPDRFESLSLGLRSFSHQLLCRTGQQPQVALVLGLLTVL